MNTIKSRDKVPAVTKCTVRKVLENKSVNLAKEKKISCGAKFNIVRTAEQKNRIKRLAKQLSIIKDPNSSKFDIDEAKNEIYHDYEKFIYRFINKTFGGINLDVRKELYQEGFVGLFTAIKYYDPYKENTAMPTVFFRSYILSACTKHLENVSSLSHHYISRNKDIEKAIKSLELQGIYSPTEQQICEAAGITTKVYRNAINMKELSVSKCIDEVDPYTMPPSMMYIPEKYVEEQEIKGILYTAINSLSNKEKIAFLQRNELIDGKDSDFRSIANNLSVSVDKAKYLFENANKKLSQHPLLARLYSNFLSKTRQKINKNSFQRISQEDLAECQNTSFTLGIEAYEETVFF